MRPARVAAALPEAEIQAVPGALETRLMMARLVGELNRASLLANRADAADLRSSAEALRAQTKQVLRRTQDRRR